MSRAPAVARGGGASFNNMSSLGGATSGPAPASQRAGSSNKAVDDVGASQASSQSDDPARLCRSADGSNADGAGEHQLADGTPTGSPFFAGGLSGAGSAAVPVRRPGGMPPRCISYKEISTTPTVSLLVDKKGVNRAQPLPSALIAGLGQPSIVGGFLHGKSDSGGSTPSSKQREDERGDEKNGSMNHVGSTDALFALEE